jgi:hypothetical protein
MTIPGQTFNVLPGIPDADTLMASASHSVAVPETPELPISDPLFLASTENTRAALLKLSDSPRDASALASLWYENRTSIENEMLRHLRADSNSPLFQKFLPRLIWHARFFCEEIDHPRAWVSRCANLEARRLALQLNQAR